MINIYIPHDKVPIVQGQEVFGVINFLVVLHINPRSSHNKKAYEKDKN
jgi:hypothetical protein